jgi:hypothetical protein
MQPTTSASSRPAQATAACAVCKTWATQTTLQCPKTLTPSHLDVNLAASAEALYRAPHRTFVCLAEEAHAAALAALQTPR